MRKCGAYNQQRLSTYTLEITPKLSKKRAKKLRKPESIFVFAYGSYMMLNLTTYYVIKEMPVKTRVRHSTRAFRLAKKICFSLIKTYMARM